MNEHSHLCMNTLDDFIKKTNELDFELTEAYCKRYGEGGGGAIPNVTIIV